MDSENLYYKIEVFENNDDSSRWVEINPKLSEIGSNVLHEGLSENPIYPYIISLPFTFPFYGTPLTTIHPTTNGFVFVGLLIHDQLSATQFVAPLMAEYDLSLSADSNIFYYIESDTRAIIQWDNVYLHRKDDGDDTDKQGLDQPFTFQVQLYNNGDIIFSYKKVPVPVEEINDWNHYVKVGISEAFYEVETRQGMAITYIHEYNKVEVDFEYVKDDTGIVLTPRTMCSDAQSCSSCAILETEFDCGWCPKIKTCSDGTYRYKQNWTDAQCDEPNNSLFNVDECNNYKEPCTAGNFMGEDGNCYQCRRNTYSGDGAAFCTECPYGKTSPAGSKSIDDCENDDDDDHYSGARQTRGTRFALVLLVFIGSLLQ